MSAENAWRAVVAELLDAGIQARWETGSPLDLRTFPMPPAFRAAVEAEAAKAFEAGVRAGWQFSTEDFNSEMWVGPLSEQRVEDDVVARAIRDRALLSRLEAKGESYE